MIIKDERLKKVSLNNIRIAFIFQSIGLLGILVYRFFILDQTFSDISDLFILIIGTQVLLGYLNLPISVDAYEKHTQFPKSLRSVFFIALVAGLVLGGVSYFASTDPSIKDVILPSIVVFVCFFCSFFAAYMLQKKRKNDEE